MNDTHHGNYNNHNSNGPFQANSDHSGSCSEIQDIQEHPRPGKIRYINHTTYLHPHHGMYNNPSKMSDLQRQFAKVKLASLPALAPEPLYEDSSAEAYLDESRLQTDDDSSSASSASSTGTIIPTSTHNLFARPACAPKRSLEAIPWTVYFERELFVPTPTTTHHAYLCSPTGSAPLFVTHHGAGSSGLSFGVLAAEIRKILPGAGVLSLDARGHGSTRVTCESGDAASKGGLDLSLQTLTTDLHAVILGAQKAMSWAVLPHIVLVGHSLGGAVVTSLAHSGMLGNAVLGYAVLDVVEGSAMDALTSMQTYLSTRPTGFASVAQGIEWHIRSRTVRNSTSARTSVPALLVEEGSDDAETGQTRRWKWRTDLAATQPFWEGWFSGLSKRFLEARGGKLLLLAGTDRLDKELTIGQMQGKYALQVFPEAGHFIHEDLPEKTAGVIVDFYKRNDRSALVLPPKVSDILRAGRKI